MVSHIIQELEVHTVVDETGTTAKINRGVTQGGPASLTLFNIYIDTLAIQLCELDTASVCRFSYVRQWITSRELQCAYMPMTSYYLQILCEN